MPNRPAALVAEPPRVIPTAHGLPPTIDGANRLGALLLLLLLFPDLLPIGLALAEPWAWRRVEDEADGAELTTTLVMALLELCDVAVATEAALAELCADGPLLGEPIGGLCVPSPGRMYRAYQAPSRE